MGGDGLTGAGVRRWTALCRQFHLMGEATRCRVCVHAAVHHASGQLRAGRRAAARQLARELQGPLCMVEGRAFG